VLVGGCGSGRTTVLHQLRDRIGRNTAQYIDVERTATTPERFLRAVTGASPFPGVDTAPPTTPRAAFDQALEFLARARAGAAEPATLLLDEFLELRTFESFPGLRRVLHDLIDGLGTSGNRFVLTSRYMARTLRPLTPSSSPAPSTPWAMGGRPTSKRSPRNSTRWATTAAATRSARSRHCSA